MKIYSNINGDNCYGGGAKSGGHNSLGKAISVLKYSSAKSNLPAIPENHFIYTVIIYYYHYYCNRCFLIHRLYSYVVWNVDIDKCSARLFQRLECVIFSAHTHTHCASPLTHFPKTRTISTRMLRVSIVTTHI